MKSLYKKNIITLKDISFNKQEGPEVAHEKFLVGKLIVVPPDTLYKESNKVESEEEFIEATKGENWEGNKN
jgi:hypothetical protein